MDPMYGVLAPDLERKKKKVHPPEVYNTKFFVYGAQLWAKDGVENNPSVLET